jgi:hypothetical protein
MAAAWIIGSMRITEKHLSLLFFAVVLLVPSIALAQEKSPDFDGNGKVDFEDFFLYAAAFGSKASADLAKFDLDSSGVVDIEDFFRFAAAFGPPSPAAAPKGHTLFGWLKESGRALSGITVELKGERTAVVTTDDAGEFRFRDLPDGTYTLTPTQPGWVFSPRSSTAILSSEATSSHCLRRGSTLALRGRGIYPALDQRGTHPLWKPQSQGASRPLSTPARGVDSSPQQAAGHSRRLW